MKIGRNSLCPCGSGKKYKRCCLRLRDLHTNAGIASVVAGKARLDAEWIEKYGHVRPLITAEFQGQRVIAVGSRLLFNPNWKTFHDFLFTYTGDVFERDWFADELSQPLDNRHPLMQWYQLWFDFYNARKDAIPKGAVVKVEAPPAQVSALLSFAYDLYTLENHSLMPKRLVNRLRVKDQFQGARYETYVAAAFLRAGFTIELEDETDPSSTHCEFAATHQETGRKFSVEAKSRRRPGFLGCPGQPKPLDEIEGDVSGLLVPALRKVAKHERIVFIDVNVPPSDLPLSLAEWFQKIASQLTRAEKNPQHKDLPSAIVFLTNFPYHFVEPDEALRGSGVLFSGFKLSEFHLLNGGSQEAVAKKFPEIVALHASLLKHTQVPHQLK